MARFQVRKAPASRVATAVTTSTSERPVLARVVPSAPADGLTTVEMEAALPAAAPDVLLPAAAPAEPAGLAADPPGFVADPAGLVPKRPGLVLRGPELVLEAPEFVPEVAGLLPEAPGFVPPLAGPAAAGQLAEALPVLTDPAL